MVSDQMRMARWMQTFLMVHTFPHNYMKLGISLKLSPFNEGSLVSIASGSSCPWERVITFSEPTTGDQ